MFKKLSNIGDCGIVCDFGNEVNRNINIHVISTSEIKISVLVNEEFTELAVKALHSVFELD